MVFGSAYNYHYITISVWCFISLLAFQVKEIRMVYLKNKVLGKNWGRREQENLEEKRI